MGMSTKCPKNVEKMSEKCPKIVQRGLKHNFRTFFGQFLAISSMLLFGDPVQCTPVTTREGCGCFRGLFGGSLGKLRESPGKIALEKFSRTFAKCYKFSDFGHTGKGSKPAGNLVLTLPGPCPHLPCGGFFRNRLFQPSRAFLTCA